MSNRKLRTSSCSAKGALRSLHYQIQQPQGRLVRVVQGEVFDVAIAIQWHLDGAPALSAKDLQGKPLAAAEHFA